MRNILTAALAAAALVAPAAAAPRNPDAELAKLLDGRVAGKPTDCISLHRANSSRIIDGRAIVYEDGRTLWVNRPRGGAQSLHDDDVLLTKTFGDQLCSVDSVQLIDRSSRFVRGFVILGDFVPYTLPPRVKPAS